MEKLTTGDNAPDFSLPATGGEVSLNDFAGEWLVLYFYPRDFTEGCTTEACEFRDALASRVMDATVVGISPDDVESHERFKAEHNLPFELLSDEDTEVARAYGAYGNRGAFGMGVKRSTFIIDPDGKIARAYYNVRVKDHAEQVTRDLNDLKGLQAQAR